MGQATRLCLFGGEGVGWEWGEEYVDRQTLGDTLAVALF